MLPFVGFARGRRAWSGRVKFLDLGGWTPLNTLDLLPQCVKPCGEIFFSAVPFWEPVSSTGLPVPRCGA